MIDPSTITVPAGVEYPAAYQAAVARKINSRILESRRKKAAARLNEWLQVPGNQELFEALHAETLKRRPGDFLLKMHDSLMEWGSLTDKQAAAVSKVLADRAEREQARVAENAERAARSKHVGIVGKRADFRLTLIRKFSFDGYYGPCYGHVFEDADGNVFCYLGSVSLDVEPGQTRTVRGTIKGHETRDGVAQTKLSRVTVEPEDDRPTEAEFLATRFSKGGRAAVKL